MNKISVIIPLYNKAKYIGRALNSVLAQTFKNFEIIVVDDGSTDDGPKIVKTYKDRRIRLIQQQNAGPGSARNKGLSEAKASLVAFLDADDEWMPQFLETCFFALKTNPDCDIATASYYLGENRTDVSNNFCIRGMTHGPWQLSNEISDYELKHAIYIFHCGSTLCKKTVIEKLGGFYTKNNCRLGEDYYLWLQIMFGHKIYRILKPLWWYHLEASELASKLPHINSMQPFLTDIEPIKKNCPKHLLPLLDRWQAQYALALAHESSFMGDKFHAEELINRFPLMKNFSLEYLKLKTKLFFPRLIPVVRFFKHHPDQL